MQCAISLTQRLTDSVFLVSAPYLSQQSTDQVYTWFQSSLPLWVNKSHPLFCADGSCHVNHNTQLKRLVLYGRLRTVFLDDNECLSPSYLTETQMMMMSNTAKKKDSRTPRMICSSLVNSPSTREQYRTNRPQATHKQYIFGKLSPFNCRKIQG